jgi:hypothetical protein
LRVDLLRSTGSLFSVPTQRLSRFESHLCFLHLCFNIRQRCRIRRSHRGGYEEFSLLGYNAMQSIENMKTFRRNISLESLGPKNKQERNQYEAGSKQSLAYYLPLKVDMFLRKVR